MRTFTKVVAALIVFAGCSTTAFAGATETALTSQHTQVKTSIALENKSVKKVVRSNTRLPQARNVSSHKSRTVLFYNSAVTRSKAVKANTAKTSTPNLFK